jgi:DNA-directed RNA polymerase subunit M/transcription elongation factor TFIIS
MISYSDIKLLLNSLRKLGDLAKLQSDLEKINSRLDALEGAGKKPSKLTCELCGHNPVTVTHRETHDEWGTHQETSLTCPACGNKTRDSKMI